MKAVMEDKPVETVSQSKEAPAPSEEQIRAQWPKLAEKYESKPRLAALLNSTTIEIEGDETSRTVYFEVVNQAQKDWVEAKLLYDLEGNLRALLNTVKVYLRVKVRPDDAPQERQIYMPSEQADVLMNENHEVNRLVKDFELEIK
jgi:chromosomal replication initiation ATPase DnaA